MPNREWKLVALGRLKIRGLPSDVRGFLMHIPLEVFQLSRGKDGEVVVKGSGLVDNEDNRAAVGLDGGTSLNQGKVTKGVVFEAMHMCGPFVWGNAAHVVAFDAAIGASVNEGFSTPSHVTGISANPIGVGLGAGNASAGVGVEAEPGAKGAARLVTIVSGRHHL